MEYKIYMTKYKYQIEQIIRIIDRIALDYFKSLGYNKNHHGNIISKTNGVDNPKATTNQWALPENSPDGTWFCPSLMNNEEYAKGHDMLISECKKIGIEFQHIKMPPEWDLERKEENGN